MKIDPDILGRNIFSFCVSIKSGLVLQSRENKPVCYNSAGFYRPCKKQEQQQRVACKVVRSVV